MQALTRYPCTLAYTAKLKGNTGENTGVIKETQEKESSEIFRDNF